MKWIESDLVIEPLIRDEQDDGWMRWDNQGDNSGIDVDVHTPPGMTVLKVVVTVAEPA